MKKFGILLGLSLMSAASFAQFSLEGQFRPRTEFRNGFKKPIMKDQEPALFTEQRTRLTATYKDEKIRTKLSIQDVRIWGEVGQINKSDNLLSVHEAYADYLLSSKSYLRFGRQEWVYDDARILGNLDWAAQGRSHDAVKFVTVDTAGKWELHLAASYNQDGTPQEPAKLQGDNAAGSGNSFQNSANVNAGTNFQLPNPKSTMFAWFKKSYKGGGTSFLLLNDVLQDTDTSTWMRPTLGLNTSYKVGDIKFDGTFYYQFGTQSITSFDSLGNKSTSDKSYTGSMAGLDITYTGLGKVVPTLGFNFLSGDDKTTSDVEGFNPLYGTHHKFYGLMDYFYVGNGHNGGGNQASGGLIDVYAKALIKTGGKAKFLAHLHFFSSPTDINYTDDQGMAQTTTSLGSELDIVYIQPLAKGVMLKAGYSQFFATDGTYYAKGVSPDNDGGMNNWAWVMINFAPKFL